MPYSVPFIFLRCPAYSIKDVYNLPKEKDFFFEKALYLASTDFWKQYQREDLLKPNQKKRIKDTLLKYWMRTCSRSTPFGLFAGTTLVDLSSSSTSIILKDRGSHAFINRIDSKYFFRIIEAIEEFPHIKNKIKYAINNTIYELNNSFRFISYYNADDGNRKYILEEIEKSQLLKDVRLFCESARGANELKKFIKEKVGASDKEVEFFISEMVSSNFLMSTLIPPITGKEKLEILINQLEDKGEQNALISDLKDLDILIKQKQSSPRVYDQVGLKIKKILNSKVAIGSFIQTDLTLATHEAIINDKLISELISQVESLMIFIRNKRNEALDQFKKSFVTRYDRQWVQLCEALDPDQGIGYGDYLNQLEGNKLIEGITFGGSNKNRLVEQSPLGNFILKKYDTFINNQDVHISISENDIKSLSEGIEKPNLSSSLTLMGVLMKINGKLDTQNFCFELKTLFGPSAASLIGRFAYDGGLLHKKVKKLLKQEEQEFANSVFAEIVYSPQERIANVVSRACLRDYEIPILSESGLEKSQKINIADLFVTVINDEVILFSDKLKKRIIPRLSTAHNFHNNELPVYKFLCDLQFQKFSNSNIWNWGSLAEFSFLPRVFYKNIILKKAMWRIEMNDITTDEAVDYKSFASCIAKYRQKRKIPEKVIYKEADNELLVDFTKKEGVELFFDCIKKKRVLKIEEYLNTSENCIVFDENSNPYISELIIPLSKSNKSVSDPVFTMENPSRRRLFSINSEWIYFKIYCSEKNSDNLLANELFTFSENLINNGGAELFFFIRHKDSSSHIRIRFYNSQASRNLFVQERLMQIMTSYITSQVVQKVSIDTYIRELERYHDFIEESELFFFADSLCVMRLLVLIKNESDPVYRLLISIRSIDIMFDDFEFSEMQKRNFMKETYIDGWQKTVKGKKMWDKCNEKYAQVEKRIYAFMQTNDTELFKIFAERKEHYRKATNKIRKNIKDFGVNQSIRNLIKDYIHLMVNRLFPSKQQTWEVFICFCLDKYYYSKSVRQRD